MSRSVLLISPWLGALASCVATAGAVASDLTVSGRTSQTVELNDNYSLSTPKSGVLGAYSTGSFNALYRTPATRFSLSGDIVYRKLFGPGAENSSFSETTNDGLNLRIDNRGNALGDNNYFTASRRRTDSSLVQRDELGFSTTSVKSNLITNSAGGGISRRLSDQDVINLSATIRNTSYEPSSDTTTPLTSYGASVGWSHSATRTIDVRVSSNANYSVFDNTANTRTLLSTTTGGATIRLSDRLTIGGNAGVTVIKTTQDVAGPVVIVPDITDPLNTSFFTPAPAVAGTTIGPTFDANLNYRLLKDTSFYFTASQGVSQGLLGDITSRTAFTAGINHTINAYSSLNATATLSTLDPPAGGTGSTFFVVTTSYSYRLSQDWLATASYIYRQIENTSSSTSASTAGSASSNAVLFVLSKGFVLKP